MRILLDNCVPRAFERDLIGQDVTHCSRLGWEKLSNGKLLAAAQAEGFSVMVTVDRSLQFQQNMAGRTLSVIYLRTPTNSLEALRAMVSQIQERLPNLDPGTVVTLNHPSMR